MCTLVILRRPGHPWPVLLAANRDELVSRPALAPGRHWPEWPEVIAGLDVPGGGSWLGINNHGLIAAVLNRDGTLGPAAGKRSRGELVLEALDHAEAGAAAGALADLQPQAYRPFNLVVADPRDAYWVRHGGDGEIRVHRIADGLHLLAGTELDDPGHPRIRRFLPRFRAAPAPNLVPYREPGLAADAAPTPVSDQPAPTPAIAPWAAWIALLQARQAEPGGDPRDAMNLDLPMGQDRFATVSASLIALPAYPGFAQRPQWLHADGAPDRVTFVPVDLALPANALDDQDDLAGTGRR